MSQGLGMFYLRYLYFLSVEFSGANNLYHIHYSYVIENFQKNINVKCHKSTSACVSSLSNGREYQFFTSQEEKRYKWL